MKKEYAGTGTYWKMQLWIDELPQDCSCTGEKITVEYEANKEIHWFPGILCLELRIAPRDASNYAMLNLRFTEDDSFKFQVIYYHSDDEIVRSDFAMPNDVVRAGIVNEYMAPIQQEFDELSLQNIFPSGKLEILGGRHGMIGSSAMAVRIVLRCLLKIYQRNGDFDDDEIKMIIENNRKYEF